MITAKTVMTIILALSLSGCAFQAGPIQGTLGNSNVEKTEEDGTVTKTSGAEMSIPFANFLKGLIDAAAKFIPGSGNTNVTVTVPGAEVVEE